MAYEESAKSPQDVPFRVPPLLAAGPIASSQQALLSLSTCVHQHSDIKSYAHGSAAKQVQSVQLKVRH